MSAIAAADAFTAFYNTYVLLQGVEEQILKSLAPKPFGLGLKSVPAALVEDYDALVARQRTAWARALPTLTVKFSAFKNFAQPAFFREKFPTVTITPRTGPVAGGLGSAVTEVIEVAVPKGLALLEQGATRAAVQEGDTALKIAMRGVFGTAFTISVTAIVIAIAWDKFVDTDDEERAKITNQGVVFADKAYEDCLRSGRTQVDCEASRSAAYERFVGAQPGAGQGTSIIEMLGWGVALGVAGAFVWTYVEKRRTSRSFAPVNDKRIIDVTTNE